MPKNNSSVRKQERREAAAQRQNQHDPAVRLLYAIFSKVPPSTKDFEVCDWCSGDGLSFDPNYPCIQCGGSGIHRRHTGLTRQTRIS